VADGVTVATLHAAKGLEWDHVFVCGVVEGTLPITFAETPDEVEEERRLLYVGLTRARTGLAVSWALARNPGGRPSRRPSRFLDGLRPRAASDVARERRSSKKATPKSCRVCGGPLHSTAARKVGRCDSCPATYDEALYEELRAWRLRTAQEESVPAYVVFTDLTLQAIAETKPSTESELLAISGIGASKRDKYGDAVLALLADRP
jgi:DNA helicase-2/ATP-dependent DNA helicase PcrA